MMKPETVLRILLLCLFNLAFGQGRNVALGQSTSQLADLEYADYLWTADKAVDNCTLQDDPETQRCCSSSTGNAGNFWRVDFDRPYIISSIVVFGREAEFSTQTKDFRLSIVSELGLQEEIYDNVCCSYGSGVFTIPVDERPVESIIIIRPTGSILTLCEVQVFEALSTTTVVSTNQGSNMTDHNNGSRQYEVSHVLTSILLSGLFLRN